MPASAAAAGPCWSLRTGAAASRCAASRPFRRHGSTASIAGAASAVGGRARALFYGGAAAASACVLYLYATDTRAGIHRWIVPPLMRLAYADAEDGHHAGTALMKLLFRLNLHPRERASSTDADVLSLPLFGTQLSNPVGISAGLDKDGEIADALFALGPAIVEIGGCTPRPEDGNPRPRVFRVPALDGIVNRYGLNSRGADDVALRLRNRLRRFARSLGVSESAVLGGDAGVPPGSLQSGRLLAVQVAKNKETDERDPAAVARDYVYCVRKLARYADIIVVNVSSPNTPGLRSLQATEPLTRLLSAVVDEASRTDRKVRPRVMVKVSPDEDEDAQMEGIARAVHLSGVDGVIVGNTTRRRKGLVHEGVQLTHKEHAALMEQGGYSGPAMFGRTLDLVRRYRKLLDAQSHLFKAASAGGSGDEPKVIFATGGITNGDQALSVLNAGASVAMVYTGLVYGGAGTVTRIKAEMKQQLGATSI